MSNSAFTPSVLTVPSVGGGTGQGEISVVTNGSAVTDTTGWTGASRVTSNSPLNPLTPTAFSIANVAGAESSTSGGYASFTLPSGLQNRKLKVEFYYTSPATDNYSVSVYKGSTRVPLSTDASSVTNLPKNTTGKFTAYFDADNSASWTVNVTRTSGTAGPCYITSVIVGPGIQPQGAVVGEWTSFTPVTFGATTYSSLTGRYRRVGDSAQIRISATINVASGTYWFDMPTSIGTIDTTKVRNGNYQDQYGVATYYNSPSVNYAGIVQKTNVANRVRIVGPNGGNEWSQSTNVPTTPASGHGMELEFTVPIAEWAGSGTVQLAQNDVEYAADDGSNDVFGPNGAAVPSIVVGTSTTARLLNFNGPRQAGDRYELELQLASGGGWTPAASIAPYIVGASSWRYGVEFFDNGTNFSVTFGNGGLQINGALSGAGAVAWSTGYRWRVRKSSAGAAVGFGLYQPGVSAGLVSSSGLAGRADGNVVPTGFVGELLQVNVNTVIDVTNATLLESNLTTLTLTAGVWEISGVVLWQRSGATITSPEYISGIVPNGETLTVAAEGGMAMQYTSATFTGVRVATPVVRVICTGSSMLYYAKGTGVSFATNTIALRTYSGGWSAGTPKYGGSLRAVRIA